MEIISGLTQRSFRKRRKRQRRSTCFGRGKLGRGVYWDAYKLERKLLGDALKLIKPAAKKEFNKAKKVKKKRLRR